MFQKCTKDKLITFACKYNTCKFISGSFVLCISTPTKSLKNIKGPHENFMGF